MFKRTPNIIVRESVGRRSLLMRMALPSFIFVIGFAIGWLSSVGPLKSFDPVDSVYDHSKKDLSEFEQKSELDYRVATQDKTQNKLLNSKRQRREVPTDQTSKGDSRQSTHQVEDLLLATSTTSAHQLSDLQKCQVQLKERVQRDELQTVKAAECLEIRQTRDELLKLFQFSAELNNFRLSLGMITSSVNLPLHQPFSVCIHTQIESKIRVGDLVASQGALLGEVIELIDDKCMKVLPTTSAQASFEVRLAQSGVRGVAIGMGELAEEESVGASIKLKYLERSVPAFVGEQVYLVARHQKSKGELASAQRLPSLVVGEVLNAAMKENGLFQEASVALPLRRAGIKWVTVISNP